jgi:hypothetical protein
MKIDFKRNRSTMTMATALLSLAGLPGFVEAQQATTAQTKVPAALLAQSEAAHSQTSDTNMEHSDYVRSIIGLRSAPVPLKLEGRDRLLVGLGSYLVNQATGCNDCHANPSFAPGHNPFLGQPKQVNTDGYLAGGHPFPADDGGAVIPPDITPDASGKPAGLSYPQFILAMRYGQDHTNPNRLLQVMPWPTFQELTQRDMRAIYDYLSSIPSSKCGGNAC